MNKTHTTTAKSRLAAYLFEAYNRLQVQGSSKSLTKATVDNKPMYFIEDRNIMGELLSSVSYTSFNAAVRDL